MVEYIVTQNVDYISFTTSMPRVPFDDKKYDNIKSPNSNYDNCILFDSGGLHLWHSTRADMKHHYIYSGSALEYLRQHKHEERELVKWCLEQSNITRIDIALTSQTENEHAHHGFTPHKLAYAIRDNMLKSRMKPSKSIASNDMKIETQYIGNRKSRKRLFRAYDKGLDLGMELNKLIRYELETRSGTKTIARAVVANELYGAIIRRYVDFPDIKAWLDITSTKPAQMTQKERILSARELDEQKSKSRWSWLMRSVIPTVKKAISEDYMKFGIRPEDNMEFTSFIGEIMVQLEIE